MTQTSSGQNYYEILGVSIDAPVDTIRMVWLMKIRKLHPDRVQEFDQDIRDNLALEASLLNAAYTTLQNADKRLQYDLDTGLRPARCSACGLEGALRRGPSGSVIAACDYCWQPQKSTYT
jgi:DnaJ-class molecular chaperone